MRARTTFHPVVPTALLLFLLQGATAGLTGGGDVAPTSLPGPADRFHGLGTAQIDGTPPQISGIFVKMVAPGTLYVRWHTDEPATGRVDYGLHAYTYPKHVEHAGYSTVHELLIPNLFAGVNYHFRLTSADAAGNVKTTGDGTFLVPDLQAPIIGAISFLLLPPAVPTLAWLTDEPATTGVLYGTSSAYGSHATGPGFSHLHVAVLTGIQPEVLYHYRLVSYDASGNGSVTPDLTFKIHDNVPPTPLNVAVSAVSDDQATITWWTQEKGTSRVDFGTNPGYGSTVTKGALVKSHSITLTGLSPSTTYHYKVTSTDPVGNAGSSGNATFHTQGVNDAVEIAGELKAWYPITLSVTGPYAKETDASPNPFLDYRFTVVFRGPSNQQHVVPGFFDGNGQGGAAGTVWKARFAPDQAGAWTYELHFHGGKDIAVDLDLWDGTPQGPHGLAGGFQVGPRDPSAPGFYKWGKLEYVGEHYMKFRDGPYFIKGGTDSPENFLAYKGFDNTIDQPGGASTWGLESGVHRYGPHVADFGASGLGSGDDPYFVSSTTGYDSKGIIGALNYLSSRQVNSIYFLPMNLLGDGRETCPFVGYDSTSFDRTHYDISKLRQWNMVFEHAVKRGILLHFVLNETEDGNENYLDDGELGVERKLFYRELVARFGHVLAIKWNLSEENDFPSWKLQQFAKYIQDVDPYDHPIGFHTHILGSNGDYNPYEQVLGDERFSTCSLQYNPQDVSKHVETWRTLSAQNGHKWVVDADEQTDALSDTNAANLRKKVLYDSYFSGGHVEWYMGYFDLPLGGDLRVEDFRTREAMWNYMWYARKFMEQNLPFWEMVPMDQLVNGENPDNGGAEVFAKPGSVYAIYYPNASDTGSVDLSGAGGTFQKRWYDPRTGSFQGSATTVQGGQSIQPGSPPSSSHEDWVLLLKK